MLGHPQSPEPKINNKNSNKNPSDRVFVLYTPRRLVSGIITNVMSIKTLGYWLVKTEPSTYSIDDLARERSTLWEGVRNYQARNYLRAMHSADRVLVYHSGAHPAVVGEGVVVGAALPDQSALRSASVYFDPRATKENPIWCAPKIRFVKKFKEPVSLVHMRTVPALAALKILAKGSRLSVVPLTQAEYQCVTSLALQNGKLSKRSSER